MRDQLSEIELSNLKKRLQAAKKAGDKIAIDRLNKQIRQIERN